MHCYFLVSSGEGSERGGCAWEALHTLHESAELCRVLGQRWLVIGILHTNLENCLTSLRGPVNKEGHFICSKPHYLISPVSQLLVFRTGLIMTLPFQFSAFYSFLYYRCTGGTVNSMCMCDYPQQLLCVLPISPFKKRRKKKFGGMSKVGVL